MKTADGVALVTDSVRALSRMQIDTLIVPGAFLVDDVTRDRNLVQWVRKNAPHAGGSARCALAVSCLPQPECWMDGVLRPIGCTRRR